MIAATALLPVSVVCCRYHYVLDAVAGMATAAPALALTGRFTHTEATADRRRSGQ
ncbi:hypothetical protein ACP4I1_18670 [Streptomyces sp. WG4]|uniref:hypothetical protein n=1 Tax=Streptomyces sp. WG4 TaxID=3417649 RepID=UPI003CF2BD4F